MESEWKQPAPLKFNPEHNILAVCEWSREGLYKVAWEFSHGNTDTPE